MPFESLANECLLDIFQYLNIADLLRCFTQLNQRLNQLICLHLRSCPWDFRWISQKDFHRICDDFLPYRFDSIRSLRLSNSDETPQLIDLFLRQTRFSLDRMISLRSLSICDLCSDDLMIQLTNQWSNSTSLTHLTLAGCYLQYDQHVAQRLIDSIWSLPSLIYCYFNVTFASDVNVRLPNHRSLSIKTLEIWSFDYSTRQLLTLLQQTPNLQSLSVSTHVEAAIIDEISFPLLTKFSMSTQMIDEEAFARLMKMLPNLHDFSIDLRSMFIDGSQWEYWISSYASHVERIHFTMFNYSAVGINLINSFQTPFWLDRHLWVIQVYSAAKTTRFLTSYFSNVPFRSLPTHYRNSINILSTAPRENSKDLIRSMEFFIDLPIENFVRLDQVVRFDSISTLHVTIKDEDGVGNQCVKLIDRMARLRSLVLSSTSNFCLVRCLSQLFNNRSIRELNLRRENQPWSNEECHQLIQLPFVKKCLFLNIIVENRDILPDFIRDLHCLQALNATCNDHDEHILSWCQSHLPSTCQIGIDTVFMDEIRIWIR